MEILIDTDDNSLLQVKEPEKTTTSEAAGMK
jgi:hypothetical protein